MERRLTAFVTVVAMLWATCAVQAQPRPPQVVRVGYLPATHDALLFVAKEMSLFDGSRIDVQLHSFDNSVQILSALKNGQIDIGIPGVASPATDIAGRASLSIIGGAAAKSAALVAKPAFATELAKKRGVGEKMRALRGKRIGAVKGSTGLAILKQGLRTHNVSEQALTLIDYQKPPDIVSDVLAGNLDVGLLWSPHMTIAESRGLKLAMWMYEVLPDHVCCRQVARDEFLRSNERPVIEYLAGILKADRAVRRARENPTLKARVFASVRKYLVTLSDSQIEQELFAARPRTTVSPDLDARGIDKYLEAMETVELMRPDHCDYVRQKVRTEYLRQAYQRLGCSSAAAAECMQRGAATCPCTR